MLWAECPALRKKNDVIDLLRREGIYDDISEEEVKSLRFFDLIFFCCMYYNPHA